MAGGTRMPCQLADRAIVRQLGSRVRLLRNPCVGTTHGEPPHERYTGLFDPTATKS
jgi:hypothetical protein